MGLAAASARHCAWYANFRWGLDGYFNNLRHTVGNQPVYPPVIPAVRDDTQQHVCFNNCVLKKMQFFLAQPKAHWHRLAEP